MGIENRERGNIKAGECEVQTIRCKMSYEKRNMLQAYPVQHGTYSQYFITIHGSYCELLYYTFVTYTTVHQLYFNKKKPYRVKPEFYNWCMIKGIKLSCDWKLF